MKSNILKIKYESLLRFSYTFIVTSLHDERRIYDLYIIVKVSFCIQKDVYDGKAAVSLNVFLTRHISDI